MFCSKNINVLLKKYKIEIKKFGNYFSKIKKIPNIFLIFVLKMRNVMTWHHSR